MAFDTSSVMQAVKQMMLDAGVQAVTFGWPTAPTAQVSGWITAAGRGRGQDNRDYGVVIQRDVRLVGWLGYALGNAPSTVELALAALADAVETGAYAARTTNLGGTCQAVAFDFALADNPDYLVMGGAERRVWPFGVNAKQSLTVSL